MRGDLQSSPSMPTPSKIGPLCPTEQFPTTTFQTNQLQCWQQTSQPITICGIATATAVVLMLTTMDETAPSTIDIINQDSQRRW